MDPKDGDGADDDSVALVETAANDDSQRDVLELYKSGLPLVGLAARQVFRAIKGLIELDELMSAGREGLYAAARKFDPTQGVPFGAYASYRVRGAIFDTVRKSSMLPRSMQRLLAARQASGLIGEGSVAHIFTSIDTALSDASSRSAIDAHLASVTMAAIAQIESDENEDSDVGRNPGANPEVALVRHEMLDLVRAALPGLNTLERGVIEGTYFEHLTPDEIAERLNCTKSWVCRLHAQAIDRLTKRLSGRP